MHSTFDTLPIINLENSNSIANKAVYMILSTSRFKMLTELEKQISINYISCLIKRLKREQHKKYSPDKIM